MARIDCSAIRTPRIFLAIAVGLFILRLGVTAASALAPSAPPDFTADPWKNADAHYWLPQQSSKPVIYQFSAKWSDPCKKMESSALSNKQVRALIDENFEAVRVIDVARESGKNPEWITDLEKRYRVFALPTLVVVDAKGESTATLIGNCNSLSVYRFLTRAIKSDQASHLMISQSPHRPPKP